MGCEVCSDPWIAVKTLLLLAFPLRLVVKIVVLGLKLSALLVGICSPIAGLYIRRFAVKIVYHDLRLQLRLWQTLAPSFFLPSVSSLKNYYIIPISAENYFSPIEAAKLAKELKGEAEKSRERALITWKEHFYSHLVHCASNKGAKNVVQYVCQAMLEKLPSVKSDDTLENPIKIRQFLGGSSGDWLSSKSHHGELRLQLDKLNPDEFINLFDEFLKIYPSYVNQGDHKKKEGISSFEAIIGNSNDYFIYRAIYLGHRIMSVPTYPT